MKEIGIYVHIPFCKRKCSYCDFTSFCGKDNLIEDYIKDLKIEIQDRGRAEYLVKTIFIGGGTPSYIDAKYIRDILDTIRVNYNVDSNAEISLEMNPGTAKQESLKIYKEAGINRISIGLQSANDDILKQIGRIHSYKDFECTIKMVRDVGFKNINVDTMIGLPNQTIYDAEDTINKLIELDIPHISVYSLIIEPGTKIEKMLDKNEITLPDEEMERYIYWFIKRRLEENGYTHYEISNFAKIPRMCIHNLDCWSQKEYLGFGVAAASYEADVRYTNTNDISKYISNIENNERYKNVKVEEIQDKQAKMNEYMILNLRKLEGVNIRKFTAKFDKNPLEIYKKKLYKLSKLDLISLDINTIRLSKKGIDLANIVWEEFV